MYCKDDFQARLSVLSCKKSMEMDLVFSKSEVNTASGIK